MECWKIYAKYENRWLRVSVQPLNFIEAIKLEQDLRMTFGLELCING